MITYFDTSVIFGALDPGQEIHQQSLFLLNEAKGKGVVVTTTLHAYAELYNNITKAGGGRPNMPPEEAAKL